MTQSNAKEIVRDMRTVRRELRDDVQDVVGRARTLVDWRHYVRAHPWIFMTVGLAAGFLLAPTRQGASPACGSPARIATWLAKQVVGTIVSGAVAYASGQLAARPPSHADEDRHHGPPN
jgi:hypothetical protein